MPRTCGIDLGTTNSCITLAAPRSPRVVKDKQGRSTVPSVVFRDARGETMVGHAARNRIGQMPPPVATIKRWMGSERTVLLGADKLSPIQVSALILAHLKRMAEEDCGDSVDDAVVTVPAYFSLKQKQDTEAAARESGFKRVMILQEPVAAALAYCLDQPDATLNVLAYDLGGGTFDVTVLERTADDELNVLAFGGDPYLGGDNFDSLLAEELRRRLRDRNFAVEWDLERPEHNAKFQRLKLLAEEAKKRLSSEDKVLVAAPAAFDDENGQSVDVNEELSRDQLHALIGPLLERTIALTRETFERSGLDRQKLHRLIMVGGSSYMPQIRQRLAETFGMEPELVDPDTIVAVGAGIKAALSAGHRVAGQDIEVELNYPAATPEDCIRLGGRLSRSVQNWSLTAFVGEAEHTLVINGDRFLLRDLRLERDMVNEIVLSLEDESGGERLVTELQVRHDPAARTLHTPDALIAKPLAVRTVAGLEVVIPEGTKLPISTRRSLRTDDQSGTIQVPVYEGKSWAGEVVLSDVPKSLPIGSDVEVELVFDQDYSVHASARIVATGQQAKARFNLPRVAAASAVQIRQRLAAGEARCAQALESGAQGDYEALRRVRDNVAAELALPEPMLGKIAEDLSALDDVVWAIENDARSLHELQPPLAEVERRLDKVGPKAREKARGPSGCDVDAIDARLREVRATLRQAWEQRQAPAWRAAIRELEQLERQVATGIGDMSDEEARHLAMGCVQWLQDLASEDPRARRVLQRINMLALARAAVVEPQSALKAAFALLGEMDEAGVIQIHETEAGPKAGSAGVPAGLRGLLRGSGA